MGDSIIAGGVESMSLVPMIGNKFVPNPYLASEYPGVYLGMGLTAENVAKQYGVSARGPGCLCAALAPAGGGGAGGGQV